jgi:hypothetical protein
MNTTQKITKAMNVKSEIQTENVYTPKVNLQHVANELYFRIEYLRKDIESQEKTLKDFDKNNPLMLCKEKYIKSLATDKIKVWQLLVSYQNVVIQMRKNL